MIKSKRWKLILAVFHILVTAIFGFQRCPTASPSIYVDDTEELKLDIVSSPTYMRLTRIQAYFNKPRA